MNGMNFSVCGLQPPYVVQKELCSNFIDAPIVAYCRFFSRYDVAVMLLRIKIVS